MLPSTLMSHVVNGRWVGWNAHVRSTTASAPRKCCATCGDRTSAASNRVFAGCHDDGVRRATPTISVIAGSAASASTTLVPTFPVAPTTTTFMSFLSVFFGARLAHGASQLVPSSLFTQGNRHAPAFYDRGALRSSLLRPPARASDARRNRFG